MTSTLTTGISHSTGSASQCKKNRRYKTGKKEQLSLFTDGMIGYVDNSMGIYKTLLGLMCKLARLQDTRSTHKTLLYFYILAMSHQKLKFKKISVIIALKRIKYLHINLTKQVQKLHNEKYKTLKKEIKNNLNRWTDTLCSWIERLNTVAISILPQVHRQV